MNLDGTSCTSCEKIVQKVIEQNGGNLISINTKTGETKFSADEEKIEEIRKQLLAKGFGQRGEEERGNFKKIIEYAQAVLEGKKTVENETRLFNYALGTIAILFTTLAVVYYLFGEKIVNFDKYVPLVGMTILSVVSIVFSYHHMKCYKKGLSCTNGMMIGMTIGMVGGFLSGAIIGATNGMFFGSVAGVLIGVILGFDLGKHCGIMGALEGLMAGLMSGTMGAMLSVMMINDNLIAFLYFLLGVCATILGGLSYMMHREASAIDAERGRINFPGFVIFCAALASILLMIMIFGPKSAIVYP